MLFNNPDQRRREGQLIFYNHHTLSLTFFKNFPTNIFNILKIIMLIHNIIINKRQPKLVSGSHYKP